MREKLLIAIVLVVSCAFGVTLSSANFFSGSSNPGNAFTAKADWVKPFSSAGAPASTTSTTIPVTYTYGDAGTEVKEVELWVKRPGDSSYSKTATDTDPSSPSFSYTAAAGLGDYSFYTRARDNSDNLEDAPGAADATTSLVSGDSAKPVSSAGSAATSQSATFNVQINASDDAGLASVELWVKRPGDQGYSLAHTYPASGTTFSTSHSYTATAGPGGYSFYTRAKDAGNNYEDAPAAADSTTVYDATAPASSASSPSFANGSFEVTYSASDAGSGVDEVELWVRKGTSGAFTRADTDTTPASASFTYTPSAPDGTYQFYTRARDEAGNYEAAPTAPVFDDSTVYETVKPASNANGSVPNTSTASPITLNYTATDATSGVKEVELWVRRPGEAGYSLAVTDTSPASASFSYAFDGGEGLYRFYTRARDNAGNYEDAGAANGDDSTTYAVRPKAIAVSATDGSGTAGKLGSGDVLTLTFDEAISTTSLKSDWTTPSAVQTVTVVVGNASQNDTLSVSNYKVGVVSTDGDYVNGGFDFNGSSMSINGAQTVLTVVLGTPSDATKIRPGAVAAKNMTFNPDDAITDLGGNLIENFNPVEADADVDF